MHKKLEYGLLAICRDMGVVGGTAVARIKTLQTIGDDIPAFWEDPELCEYFDLDFENDGDVTLVSGGYSIPLCSACYVYLTSVRKTRAKKYNRSEHSRDMQLLIKAVAQATFEGKKPNSQKPSEFEKRFGNMIDAEVRRLKAEASKNADLL